MRTALVLGFVLAATAASAQTYGNPYGGYGTGSNPYGHQVQGHIESNGTYVQPHYQSNPNSTQLDNYGTRGNVNPYTGQPGTRSPRF